jgi:N-acetyltransferase
MSTFNTAATLSLNGVRLEPMTLAHETGLRAAAADGELWKIRVTSVPEPEKTLEYIETALKMPDREPFVVVDIASGKVIGSTSYHDIVPAIKRVEIGYTWYAKSVQRTHVNTTCKLMLMTHAFETLQCPVVGWRTDIFNFASQRAIERLGARRDAVIRHHAPRRDGTVRDTVIYSMTAEEWPAVKVKLQERLLQTPITAAPTKSQITLVPFSELDDEAYSTTVRMSPGALGERMVATNGVTFADAARNPNGWLRAVVAGGKPLGLVLLYDPTLSSAQAKKDEAPVDCLHIWRIMIGFQYQGRGYGEAAMHEVIHYATTRPGIKKINLSHMPWEGNPAPFYEKFGFKHTGEVDDGELVMEMSLSPLPPAGEAHATSPLPQAGEAHVTSPLPPAGEG